MKAADTVCFVADSSKKGQALFGITASWDEIDCFITDQIDNDFRAFLESKGIRVLTTE